MRRLLLAIGWLCTLGGAALMVLYYFTDVQLTNTYTALAVPLIPYGVLAWTLATVIFAFAGQRGIKAVAVLTLACLVVQVFWARPYWPLAPAAPAGESLRVLTMNLRCDEPALVDRVGVVARENPDIVVLQDLSQQGWDYLQTTAWLTALPRYSTQPKDQPLADGSDPCGPVVFATGSVTVRSAAYAAQPVLTVDLPAASGVPAMSVTVVPVSLPTPSNGLEPWLQGFADLDAAIASLSRTSSGVTTPLLVVGDFNATREHLPLRQLMAEHDLGDAAEQAGAGWQPTYPAGRRIPPLFAIDHILLSPSLTASKVTAFGVAYGAHRGLLAELQPA